MTNLQIPKNGNVFDNYASPRDRISRTCGLFTFFATLETDDVTDPHEFEGPGNAFDTSADAPMRQENLQVIKAWVDGYWFYGTVEIDVEYNGIFIKRRICSLSGIEINFGQDKHRNEYLTTTALELMQESIPEAEEQRQRIISRLAA